MAYYDHIAKHWHAATGYTGGAFKELVLNNLLLEKIASIDHCAILELGAGNGYFLPLVLRRFSGGGSRGGFSGGGFSGGGARGGGFSGGGHR